MNLLDLVWTFDETLKVLQQILRVHAAYSGFSDGPFSFLYHGPHYREA